MQRILGIFAVVVLALAGYQAWQNARTPHPIDAQAASIACGQMASCSDLEVTPTQTETSPFSRTYVFETGSGTVEVTCRWAWLLWGEARCGAERVGKITDPGGPERYPHQPKRGAP